MIDYLNKNLETVKKYLLGGMAIGFVMGIICTLIGLDSFEALIIGFLLCGVAVLCLWLYFLLIVSWEFYEVAKSKGHFEGKYFYYCLFFGVIGYLLIIALKDKGAASVVAMPGATVAGAGYTDELPEL